MRAAVCTLLLLAACGREKTLQGQVVDLWGAPIEGATIVVSGHAGTPASDAYGNFTVPSEPGTWRIKVGKDGYIQEELDFVVEEGTDPSPPIVELYPRPTETGFWLVGSGGYTRIEPERVEIVGNELKKLTGIKSVETRLETGEFEVVLQTDLRMDELMRLGLELTSLEFQRSAELPGSLGNTEVRVNLYVAKAPVAIDVEPMRSKNAYRITSKDTLAPGWYAFHSQDLLDPREPSDIETIPEDLRSAFPFELR